MQGFCHAWYIETRIKHSQIVIFASKNLGEVGNIVAETLCFLQMFPCLPTSGNIVAETKFPSQEAKMFPNKFRNISVAETMFPSLPTCFQMFPTRETLFFRLGMFKQCLKTIVQI